jgi:hypothetical protein
MNQFCQYLVDFNSELFKSIYNTNTERANIAQKIFTLTFTHLRSALLPRPSFPVKAPVLYGFSKMFRLYVFSARQIGDSTAYF